jgi:3'-phosphoadenosine 5'-phosphosulfate sulfotransferase (PAPS reductase)/FAD synthetase
MKTINTVKFAEEITDLVLRGALFVVNHSGGKDSQAMFNLIFALVPHDQIVVIHAHLPGVEWEGTADHVKATIGSIPYHEVVATKTFFEMVKGRGFWPSPKYRQCTSDLKRGPIEKKIREISKETGRKLIVNCVGIRAQESSARSKQIPFKKSEKNSKAGREWYDFLPVFDWDIKFVFDYIEMNGQKAHWAYSKGMSRLSCCFCIMSNSSDLKTAAKLNPELLDKYDQLEREIDQTFIMPKNGVRKFLKEILLSGEEIDEKVGECSGF